MTTSRPIARLPILILFPHNRCNCRCLMCDIWKEREAREIAAVEVARWTDEWRALGVREVVLTGGEPLMHSNLWGLCDLLKGSGFSITLLSSGLLLSRNAEEIARHVDSVIASLDGPPEVHDAIRNVPRAFERLALGVAALRTARASLPVSARCTVQKQNFRRIADTVAAAKETAFDRISFLAVDVSTDAFNRPGGIGLTPVPSLALTADELPELERELANLEQTCAADFATGFIVESPAKLRLRLLAYFSALCGLGPFPRNTCNAPWVSAVVESDGTVRPCFFHPPLGNLRQAGSLAAVLNAPGALAFRAGLDVATNPVCARCVCSLQLRQDTGGNESQDS
ncbi:MAG: radical SAM protein [Acidithiobacillales bacterium]